MKLIFALASSVVFAAAVQHKAPSKPAVKTVAPSYADVQQVFNDNCIGCHGAGGRVRAGVNLTSYDSLMAGGENGVIVKPGAPKHSVLIEALRGTNGVRHMPPRRDLEESKIALIEKWILAGAKR